MKYIVTINGKDFEVEVEKGAASVVKSQQNRDVMPKHSESAITAQPVKEDSAAIGKNNSSLNGEALRAPMPGSIIDIKVRSGEKVKKGDIIFILEAMKMENEITAPVDGVIAQVAVAKGTSVTTGDILAVIQ
jgi:biotin carboxyl carrier protein